MLIDGENTLLSDPDREHCEHALRALEHLVVIDIFLTETAELADVVLPATAWGETDGVCTNTERRVQRVRAAVPPSGVAKPDWWIICQIAQRLGFEGFDFNEPKPIFNELCRVSPIYAGLDWDRIEKASTSGPYLTKDIRGPRCSMKKNSLTDAVSSQMSITETPRRQSAMSSRYGSQQADVWNPITHGHRQADHKGLITSCPRNRWKLICRH